MKKIIPLLCIQFIAAALVLLNGALPPAPLPPNLYFNPPYVYAWLNTIYLLPSGIIVAYFSSKAFKKDGRAGILLLGCGTLAVCASTLATWAGTGVQAINFYYIILDLGILFGSLSQLAGVLLLRRDVAVPPAEKTPLLIGTYGVTAIVGALTWLGAAEGWIPAFYETQPTALAIGVLTVAGVLFSLAALMLGVRYLASRSEILYWYVVAILLEMTSIAIYLLIRHPGDPISWLYRGTTFLYGSAFLVAVLTATED